MERFLFDFSIAWGRVDWVSEWMVLLLVFCPSPVPVVFQSDALNRSLWGGDLQFMRFGR